MTTFPMHSRQSISWASLAQGAVHQATLTCQILTFLQSINTSSILKSAGDGRGGRTPTGRAEAQCTCRAAASPSARTSRSNDFTRYRGTQWGVLGCVNFRGKNAGHLDFYTCHTTHCTGRTSRTNREHRAHALRRSLSAVALHTFRMQARHLS